MQRKTKKNTNQGLTEIISRSYFVRLVAFANKTHHTLFSHEIFHSWLSSMDHLCLLRSVFIPLQIKWPSGHVRFSLCLCNFRRNEPANSYFIRPEANREKGGLILVPVGHPPHLPVPLSHPHLSLFSCVSFLSSRDGSGSVEISLEANVPSPHWLN